MQYPARIEGTMGKRLKRLGVSDLNGWDYVNRRADVTTMALL
jgi:hypothetical protein